jgi:hypothetical protein
MLEDALQACPEALWGARLWQADGVEPGFGEFWYVLYHSLFWLDLYLTGSVEGFTPPPPFTLAELDPAGLLPERKYSRAELQMYLDHGRQKCQTTIETLTAEQAQRLCKFLWGEVIFAELLLDNMRHIQEHAAQLNLFLGQQARLNARWVAQTK